jgi:hypothetical protein
MMRAEEVARKLEEEFETIDLAEPLPIRVSAGPHTATIVGCRRLPLPQWNRASRVFRFRLTELSPADGVVLAGYATEQKETNGKLKANSKLARWWRIIADYTGGRRDRIVLTEFTRFLFEVLVENVRTDNRGRAIPEAGQMQVVSEIVAIVQELSPKS